VAGDLLLSGCGAGFRGADRGDTSTRQDREKGLMRRSFLGDDEGMLFVYESPQQVAFYMKDTFIPLSCAFIDTDGTILEIHDLEPLDETPVVSASSEVRFVLEVNRGWFAKNRVTRGMTVLTEKGLLLSLF
jgi:uncharacterized membrane protein (UPF0127 family)